MKTKQPKAKIIYKTFKSHLPTNLPVNYYGLPNGKVYVVYSRFYEKKFDKQSIEFVFAHHQEFFYDYDGEDVILMENNQKLFPVMAEMIDKPDPKIKIRKVSRNLHSYVEAQGVLNQMAANMAN